MTTVTVTTGRLARIVAQLVHALIAAGITVILSYLLMQTHGWSATPPASATPAVATTVPGPAPHR
jgi:hypothetical protein